MIFNFSFLTCVYSCIAETPHGSVNLLNYLFHVIPPNLFCWPFVCSTVNIAVPFQLILYVFCFVRLIVHRISNKWWAVSALFVKEDYCADSASFTHHLNIQPVSQPASQSPPWRASYPIWLSFTEAGACSSRAGRDSWAKC